MKDKKKVAVAMSGGVDSGVAAALLVEQGYEVVGLHLNFWKDPAPRGVQGKGGFLEKVENRCCSLESMEAARKTSHQLGIPFYVKDYSKDFKKIVVDYFLAEYAAGRTPNPCVVCNKFIKFGKLLDYARALGCDYLATGHYARISNPTGLDDDGPTRRVYHLLKGIDDSKDQSYFLWTLTQDKLAHILFPVGDRRKSEVRKIARAQNLPVSDRPESFEVCFIKDRDYRDFLRRHIPETIKQGEVVNAKGEIIGKHFGLPLYTVGQRKGFEINPKSQIPNPNCGIPLYVVRKNLEKNQLIVGRGGESERRRFAVSGVNWIRGPSFAKATEGREGLRCEVRIRYQGPLLSAECKVKSEKLVDVALDEPTRGITPGQSAVFYDGEEVLGGGVIER